MATNISYPPGAQMYDIPFIGGDMAKIGRIIDLYAEPCKPTAEIWVYGFFQAIPTLMISVLKPELIDVNIRHRRGKPRKGRKARMLANAVFRDALIEIPVPRWVVFRIYEWSQRIGWYFLVADALENFAINWMSTAYRYNGCTTPTQCYTVMTGSHVLTGSGVPPWPRPILFAAVQTANFEYPAGFARPALTGKFRASWNVTFEDYQIPGQSQTPFATCLIVNGVPTQSTEVTVDGTGKKQGSGNVIIETNATPHPTIAIGAYWSNANKFCYRTGELNIYRTTDNELSADP